jgi:uncharacterized protein
MNDDAQPIDRGSDGNYDSPCVRVCIVDGQSGYCLGCGRTLAEVSRWTRYTRDERSRILAQLPLRLEQSFPPAPAEK